jgi:NADH-dependent fumarate reductase subunit C
MLEPTNVPLTSKEFTEQGCGICFGCGCYCGYILYTREQKIVDLYGHPHDPNGVGSFCTKGLTYIQQLRDNPLRLRKPYILKGGSIESVSREEALLILKEKLSSGRLGIFLDRFSDLKDYRYASAITDRVYTDALYLSFKPSSIPPQEWAEQRLIFALEFEPEFSEVMSARWIIDALERGAYLFNVSSRFSTLASKSSKNLLLKPYGVVRFLEDLVLQMEGKALISEHEESINRLLKGLSTIKESVIIVGERLLRSEFRSRVLKNIQKLVKTLGVNYSIVGDISTYPVRELKDFLEEVPGLDSLIMVGNPLRYTGDAFIDSLSPLYKVNLSLFPGISALNSDMVLPLKAFYERDFEGYRNGFGIRRHSPGLLSFGDGFCINELLRDVFNIETTAEGGDFDELPDIRDVELPEGDMPEESELYLVVDRTLVEDLGHWNPWTHAIERHQRAYLSRETARILGVDEGSSLRIGASELEVSINNNIATGVVFVPEAFEEFQPFEAGTRVGRLMRKPYLRIEEMSV